MKTGRPKKYGEKLGANGLPPSVWAWLQEEADKKGIKRTELLRQIVMEYKDRQSDPPIIIDFGEG